MQKIDVVSQCSFLLEKANNKLLWLLEKTLIYTFFHYFLQKLTFPLFQNAPERQ